MKKWSNPSLEELSLNATAYSPAGGTRIDGTYQSYDGQFTHRSYGASSGDSGTPGLTGNDPSVVPAGQDSGFVKVD